MKNGLLFVLLMAALVAMAIPAGAVAPTIGNLPTVVVGDKEDIDAATNAVLLRYVNAVNLTGQITTPNSGDTTKLKVWYETSAGSGATLRVGVPAVKSALSAAEVTALKANNPTMPPTAKELTGGTAFWLSLIQDFPGLDQTSPTNVATATAAANGNSIANYNAGGVTTGGTGKATVTLYAIDDVLTSKSWASKGFDVYSRTGGVTDQYSTGKEVIKVVEYTFEGTSNNGWTYLPMTGVFTPGTQAQTATAIGHTGASGAVRYSSWASPLYGITATNMAGYYFVATMSLSGTGATAAAEPGFRILYADGYYMHVGGLQVSTNAGITGANAPFTGNNKDIKLAWAVPSDLNEYGDTGKMNKNFTPATDLRSYSMLFDLWQMDTTDSGNIMLENCLVQKVTRPASITPAKEWGGTGTAFNTSGNGWTVNPNAAPGFNAGTGAVTASNMTLGLASSSTNNSGWFSLVPNSLSSLPAWASGKTLRTTYKIASSDANLVPNFRFLTLATYSSPVSGNSLGPIYWGDSFSYDVARGSVTMAQSANGLPGAPKTAGSTIELYFVSHTAGTGAEAAVLTPEADIVNAAGTFPSNGWARPSATLTISSMKMELLDEATVLP